MAQRSVSSTSVSSNGRTVIRVEVTIEAEAPAEAATEWEVVKEPHPALTCAERDRLAKRLSSRKTTKTPADRITAAFEAGVSCRPLDLLTEDLIGPEGCGIQNSCWIGVRPDHTCWLALRYKAVTKQLRTERDTRVIAFASQAEAEAWCRGFGREELPASL